MVSSDKKSIPVREGLWTIPSSSDEEPQLIGNRCRNCGEIYFPEKKKGICIHCQHIGLEEIKLSRRGKIFSFTVVKQRPARFYPQDAPVPYAFGWVNLLEGVQIRSLFTDCDPDTLKIGQEVELVIEKLGTDEQGNEVLTYKFRPVVVIKVQ